MSNGSVAKVAVMVRFIHQVRGQKCVWQLRDSFGLMARQTSVALEAGDVTFT